MLFVLGLLFSPMCSLGFLLFYLRTSKIKIKHIVSIVFLIAFIGIYWYPWGDNQTHFAIYYSDIVNRYYNFVLSSSYWFYDYVIYLVANNVGQYIWGYFFWLLVPFLLLAVLLWKNVESQDVANGDRWILVILLILFLGIREYLDLNRNTNAGIFLTISALIWKRSKCLSLFCFVLSFLLHDCIRYFVIFLPLGYLIYNKSIKKTDIIILITIFLSGLLIKVIAPLVVSERNIMMYLGEGGGRGVSSGFMVAQGYVNISIGILQYLIIRRNKSIISKPLYVVYITSIFIAAALSSMWVGRERYLLLSNILSTSIILVSWKKLRLCEGKSFLKFLRWIIGLYVSKIILNLMLVYSAHYVFNSATTNNEEEMVIVARSVYMPTLLLFDVDEFGFSDREFIRLYNRVNSEIEVSTKIRAKK